MNKKFFTVMMVALLVVFSVSGLVMAEEDLRRDPVQDPVELLPPDGEMPLLDEPELISGETVDEELQKFEEELLEKYRGDLMSIDGVTAVMIMEFDGVRSFVVFVKEDADIAEGAIPDNIEGYPVVVDIDYEVTIMPYGEEEDVALDVTEEVVEEAEEKSFDTNIIIYIVLGVVVIGLIILLKRKGS